MQTLINRTKAFALQPPTKFKLMVGHGGLTGTFAPRLPADTYIIFLSKPGHLISQDSVTQHRQIFRHSYLRNAISGVSPKWSIQPTHLKTWNERVYGPGDVYPNMIINFFDHNASGFPTPGTQFNLLSGLHTIKATRTNTHFKGSSAYVSNIVRFGGKGIYIVAACRASRERSNAGAMGSFQRNFRLTGGNQTSLRRIGPTDPRTNLIAQAIENIQARMAAHKRRANSQNRASPPKKTKKYMYTFAPGRPTPAASTRRRPKTRRTKTLRRT